LRWKRKKVIKAGLFETARRSLAGYKANPVLFVPPLVAFFVSILTPVILSRVVAVPREGFPTITLSLLMAGFGVLFLLSVVSFLVILGQANMSGKVITEGKTRLADWGIGIRKYFFRVLGIGLVFLGIMFVLFMIVMVAYALTILTKIITPEGVITPPITPTPQTTYMDWTMTLITALIMTIAQSFFYIWLAPAILDDKGIGTSLDLGIKTIRKSGRVFVGFIVLFLIVSAIATLVNSFPAIIGVTVPPLVGSLTPTSIVSQIIEKIFSPLWFLIAFTIYHQHSVQTAEITSG